MKKIILMGIILVAAALLASSVQQNVQNVQNIVIHRSLFPIVYNDFRSSPKKGCACAGLGIWGAEKIQSDLGVSFFQDWGMRPSSHATSSFTHYKSFRCAYGFGDRCDWDELHYIPHDSDEIALFLNEPDGRGQDGISPTEAAGVYFQLRRARPRVRWVIGNLAWFKPDYMAEFFSEYERIAVSHINSTDPDISIRPDFYAYGVHGYGVLEFLPKWEQFLDEQGYHDKPIWVTEHGSCTPGIITQQIALFESDPRVEKYFGFAPWAYGGSLGASCLSFYQTLTLPELSEMGREFAENP